MKVILKNSMIDTDKHIRSILRENQINSGMHMKRKVQAHKDKTIYSRKNLNKIDV